MKADRSWQFAKGIKDYMIMVGKNEYSYEEIQEIIESEAALNFAQDLYRYSALYFWEWRANKECFYKDAE